MQHKIPIEIVDLFDIDIKGSRIELANQLESTGELNFRAETGCHLFVQAIFGARKLGYLVIDTGASKTVFDEKLTEKYVSQLKIADDIFSSGVNAAIDLKIGMVKKLRFGDFVIENYLIGLTDLSHINQIYKQFTDKVIWGLLGSDFLRAYNAKLDYKKKTLTIKSK